MGTSAMEPTLRAGQKFTARPIDPGRYTPKRGDIIVFRAPTSWGRTKDAHSVARVIATGGTTVACCDPNGHVTVDGAALDEPYLGQDSPLDTEPNPAECRSRRFGPVKVAPDHLFVMGDTRQLSQDSRCLGTLPVATVTALVDQPTNPS
jgi:signal peptidase I